MIPITQARMRSQYLTGDPLATPQEVVRRLGAVQSQDFGPAKWSIAQRTRGVTDAAMQSAFAAGDILRTHILRPTWHFVLPVDIRWMLELTAPRVHTLNAHFYRNQELDTAVLDRCRETVVNALQGGHHLTRKEIAGVLEGARILTTPLRLSTIMMNLELSGVVCSGTPHGKQQTYALLEDRAPRAKYLTREEALAELALRYFTSHGPATVKDFRWWSSLTMADTDRALAMAALNLEHELIDGVMYWFAPSEFDSMPASPAVHLVQGYDEYIVGYSESKYMLDVSGAARSVARARGIHTHSILLDGQVAGQWKPMPKKHEVIVDAILFAPFGHAQAQELDVAVQSYGEFLGLPATLNFREGS